MTQNQHLLPSDFGLNSFQELIYQAPNKAGDHLDDFDAFRDAMLIDLAPMRPHEAVMAENITMIKWKMRKSKLKPTSHPRKQFWPWRMKQDRNIAI